MGQGALSKLAVKWWLSLRSSRRRARHLQKTRFCLCETRKTPPDELESARPGQLPKPACHAPFLGRPSGRTEGAIRLRPDGPGAGHIRWRDLGHSRVT